MRQLHLLRRRGDTLAAEVVGHQVAHGDEVRVVLLGDAAAETLPEGVEVFSVPPLEYDAVVELLEWCERVVSW